MSIVLRLFVSVVLLAPSLVRAATLETPGNGDNLSGIGVIRGWKCEAVGDITVVIDGGSPIPMAYGNERADVRNAEACPSAQVGFVSIMNWGSLGDGTHTAVVYDNGAEFARSTFEVTTLGKEFVAGVSGEVTLREFPDPKTDVMLRWQEAQQQFVVTEVEDGGAAAGQCCRYIEGWGCSTGKIIEREYNWRSPQTKAGGCIAQPQDDTGLVGIWVHTTPTFEIDFDYEEKSVRACTTIRERFEDAGYRLVGAAPKGIGAFDMAKRTECTSDFRGPTNAGLPVEGQLLTWPYHGVVVP